MKRMFAPRRWLSRPNFTPALAAALAALALFSTGCETKAPAPGGKKFIFFPGAPDPPRLQFLTSFSTEKELGATPSAFATFITGEKPTYKGIGKPYGLAAHGGQLFVCDSASQGVLIADLEKKTMSMLKISVDATFAEPVNLAIDTDGTRYVVDDRSDQMTCLDGANQMKYVLGHQGEMRPRDVAVSGDRVYLADIKDHCVRVYDKASHQPLYSIPQGTDATNAGKLLVVPSNIALDADGRLYASDIAAGRVQVYDASGHYERSVGDFGDEPQHGLLKRPKGVAVDKAGVIYVVDSAYQLVQMFDSQGRYLMCFGYPGSSGAAGLTLPAKVMIDYDDVKLFESYASPNFQVEYLVFVSNQFGPRKIAVYGFGHKR